MRSQCTSTKGSPRSLQLEKACEQQRRPSITKNKLILKRMHASLTFFKNIVYAYVPCVHFLRLPWTNCNKPGGLKEQKSILLRFWKPEVWNGGSCRATLPPEALKQNSCLFQFLVAPVIPSGCITLISSSYFSRPSFLFPCLLLFCLSEEHFSLDLGSI